MKILLINGSPHSNGCTNRALIEIKNTLEREGVDSEILHVPADVTGCRACGACRKGKNGCAFGHNDGVNEAIFKMKECDGVILGSPVYYSNASGSLRAFADRFFYAGSAFEGGVFEGKVGAAVANCRRGGASATFEQLNQYFLISKMIVPASQYWNQTHGNRVEEIEKDEEGLQTMRTLALNTAWILKCINAGKAAGIERPKFESQIKTNFIR